MPGLRDRWSEEGRGERRIALVDSEMQVEVGVGVRTVKVDEFGERDELKNMGNGFEFGSQVAPPQHIGPSLCVAGGSQAGRNQRVDSSMLLGGVNTVTCRRSSWACHTDTGSWGCTEPEVEKNEFYEGTPHGSVEPCWLAPLAQLADSRKLDKQIVLPKKAVCLLTNLCFWVPPSL